MPLAAHAEPARRDGEGTPLQRHARQEHRRQQPRAPAKGLVARRQQGHVGKRQDDGRRGVDNRRRAAKAGERAALAAVVVLDDVPQHKVRQRHGGGDALQHHNARVPVGD
ncbi:MAG: hypothetical protein CMP54_03955 [Flavobacteriales bacterium]|nr:hypothetical protein [Flavobacteriales bacterium]